MKQIAWKAQHRLHKRYKTFAARGKNKSHVVTALGRELLGFIWAIALNTEQKHKLASAASNNNQMFSWITKPMKRRAHEKEKPCLASRRTGSGPNPRV